MNDILASLQTNPQVSIQVELLTSHDIPEPKSIFLLSMALLIFTFGSKQSLLNRINRNR